MCIIYRWDHLNEVLQKILVERPRDIGCTFEEFSYRVRDCRFRPQTDHLLDVFVPPSHYELAQKLLQLLVVRKAELCFINQVVLFIEFFNFILAWWFGKSYGENRRRWGGRASWVWSYGNVLLFWTRGSWFAKRWGVMYGSSLEKIAREWTDRKMQVPFFNIYKIILKLFLRSLYRKPLNLIIHFLLPDFGVKFWVQKKIIMSLKLK